MQYDDVARLRDWHRGWEKSCGEVEVQRCAQFAERIRGRRNFSENWIVGADSVCTSNIRDHDRNDQHTHAMSLLNKQRAESLGLGPASYVPIAKALNKLSEDERG